VQDPHQVRNLLAPLNDHAPFAPFDAVSFETNRPILSKDRQRLLNRLDALVLVLKTCVGETCHQPYKALFPDIASTGQEIYSLSQALDPRFDEYFQGLPKVIYSKCALGYQARLEKPDWSSKLAFRAARGLVVQGML
jgi:N-acetylglucosamine-6-sulfatase